MSKDLSIVIPARNEMFLARTIQDLLENIEGNTEIITVLDGQWSDPAIKQDERVKVVYLPESIGQRSATNLAVRLSDAKYIMKIDAHCAVDKGFDVKLMADMQDDWTVAPLMRNLHVFNWVCRKCGDTRYQGPTPIDCPKCDNKTDFYRDIVWIAKQSPKSFSYRFDSEPHFQYHGEYSKSKEALSGGIVGGILRFDTRVVSSKVIGLLTDFTSSHKFSCRGDSLWLGKNVAMNTMSFPSVDNGRGIGIQEIFGVGNQSQVGGVATPPVFTDMVDDGNVSTSSSGNGANHPSVGNSMCELFLPNISASTITPLIQPSGPVPATRYTINGDIVDELNRIIGGEFVYSEKTNSFHNGSVTLYLVRDKNITESMSLQGSCFMCTRAKYWELGLSDESFGSWGSQGIEVACKTWLSGGKVMINKKTWYAHLFRTQGGDFGFPYPQSGKQVKNAKSMAKDLFFNNKWEKQKLPLSWLIEKFKPVPGWHDAGNEEALKYVLEEGAKFENRNK